MAQLTDPSTRTDTPPQQRTEADARGRTSARPQFGASAARTGAWIVLLAWAAFSLTPIIWVLLAVTKNNAQLQNDFPFSFGSFDNIFIAWGNLQGYDHGVVLDWIGNSVVLTVGGIALAVLTTVPAGYALGTREFPGRKSVLMVSLLLMLVPASALVLPLFLEMTTLGLVGNPLSVILPLGVFPFGVYMSFIYFSTTVDKDVYSAARLDGCNEWQVFARVAVPLAKPIVVLLAFFAFMRNWNEYFLPFVMLGGPQHPLPVGLATLASNVPQLNPLSAQSADIGLPELILATIISMAPVMIVLIVAQRTVLKSADLMGGGLRG
ncbi:carbohydrate ABC transporter permease [Microbacterium awajiense]|uniref:Carbohydrate ABC transporter permease n=1 Tax=Microbacterium awajiense TaxID=415214 RepID=A0ABP7AK68_9MICO